MKKKQVLEKISINNTKKKKKHPRMKNKIKVVFCFKIRKKYETCNVKNLKNR